MNKIEKTLYIQRIIGLLIVIVLLIVTFFQNDLFAKIFITPFIICSFSLLGKNAALLYNKIKLAKVFKNINNTTILIYVFAFLLYAAYYAIKNSNYSLLVFDIAFTIVTIFVVKKKHSSKK